MIDQSVYRYSSLSDVGLARHPYALGLGLAASAWKCQVLSWNVEVVLSLRSYASYYLRLSTVVCTVYNRENFVPKNRTKFDAESGGRLRRRRLGNVLSYGRGSEG